LINHYKHLDPCNCFNSGIGRTSKRTHWRDDRHRELHHGEHDAEALSPEGTRQEAAVKAAASVQRTS
jgi:D-lactate dehydrogenase, membrane binding